MDYLGDWVKEIIERKREKGRKGRSEEDTKGEK